jgi:hypothetical protein
MLAKGSAQPRHTMQRTSAWLRTPQGRASRHAGHARIARIANIANIANIARTLERMNTLTHLHATGGGFKGFFLGLVHAVKARWRQYEAAFAAKAQQVPNGRIRLERIDGHGIRHGAGLAAGAVNGDELAIAVQVANANAPGAALHIGTGRQRYF